MTELRPNQIWIDQPGQYDHTHFGQPRDPAPVDAPSQIDWHEVALVGGLVSPKEYLRCLGELRAADLLILELSRCIAQGVEDSEEVIERSQRLAEDRQYLLLGWAEYFDYLKSEPHFQFWAPPMIAGWPEHLRKELLQILHPSVSRVLSPSEEAAARKEMNKRTPDTTGPLLGKIEKQPWITREQLDSNADSVNRWMEG